MHIFETRFPPPLVFLAVALGMWAVVRAAAATPFAGSAIFAFAGGALVLVGVGVSVAGFMEFRRANATIDPVNLDRAATLVSSGVFSRTRNPMYLGLTLILLGWAAFLTCPWALVGPALFVLFVQRFQILPEERALKAKFGEAFAAYQRRVRRWI